MSSKAALSQLEVNERRLKGIYDQLESCNYKKAVSEADKALKKNSNLSPAKVLKALALQRLNKGMDAQTIISEVLNSDPTDEATLNSLSFYFRETNQREKVVEIYEKACQKHPEREEMWSHLYFCHVKNMNFAAQQKVGLQLKKLNSNHIEYPLWPIVSNVLLGLYSQDSRFLKLGEAMLIKFINSNGLLSAERVQFLIFVLEKQEKWEEALQFLQGKQLTDVVNNDQNKMLFNGIKISILNKLNRKSEACEIYLESITENSEDIKLWKDYIDLVVGLDLGTASKHSVSSLIERIELLDMTKATNQLIQIHLTYQLQLVQKHSLASRIATSFIDQLAKYAIQFANKPNCIYDLYNFMKLTELADEDRHLLTDTILREFLHLTPDTIKNNKDVETYHLCEVFKMCMHRDNQATPSQLQLAYDNTIQYSNDITSTEIKPVDNLIRVAVNQLYQRWNESRDDNCDCIIEALGLLRSALTASPTNHFLGLQLTHIIGQLRCSSMLIDQLSKLEVKQLMWDSLGHLFILPLLYCPSYTERLELLGKNMKRKEKNLQELQDGWVVSYRLGNYSRIPELIDFNFEIENSVMIKLSSMEIMYCNTIIKSHSLDDLFTGCSAINLNEIESNDPKLDISIYLNDLKDHRDLDVVPDFPIFERSIQQEDRDNSFAQLKSWIIQRMTLLRLFYASAKITMETVVKLDKMSSDLSISYDSERSNWYQILSDIRDHFSNNIKNKGYPRLSYYALPGCVELPDSISTNLSNLGSIIINCMLGFHDKFVRKQPVKLANLTEIVSEYVSNIKPNTFVYKSNGHADCGDNDQGMIDKDILTQMPNMMYKLTLLCENATILTLLFSILDNLTKPLKPKEVVKKKNRKKKNIENDINESKWNEKNQFVEFIQETKFYKSLLNFIEELDQVIDQLNNQVLSNLTWDAVATNGEFNSVLIGSWRASIADAVNLLENKKKGLLDLRYNLESNSLLVEVLTSEMAAC